MVPNEEKMARLQWRKNWRLRYGGKQLKVCVQKMMEWCPAKHYVKIHNPIRAFPCQASPVEPQVGILVSVVYKKFKRQTRSWYEFQRLDSTKFYVGSPIRQFNVQSIYTIMQILEFSNDDDGRGVLIRTWKPILATTCSRRTDVWPTCIQ